MKFVLMANMHINSLCFLVISLHCLTKVNNFEREKSTYFRTENGFQFIHIFCFQIVKHVMHIFFESC